MMVTGVAPVVAPLLGGQLLAVWHWHAVFWVLAGIGLASGLAVAFTLAESLPADRRARNAAAAVLWRSWGILSDRRFIGFASAIGFSSGALFAYISGSPTVLMGQYRVSPRAFSGLFAANAVGLFLAARLNRRLLPGSARTGSSAPPPPSRPSRECCCWPRRGRGSAGSPPSTRRSSSASPPWA